MGYLKTGLFLMLCWCLFSCHTGSRQQLREVDGLNHRAFQARYTQLDTLQKYADQALRKALTYHTGEAESYNNMGLAAFMAQDLKKAEYYYGQVSHCTRNQLELLLSDIGMMKVCVRGSYNKRFYDYETRIKKRLKRIDEEKDELDVHDQERLSFAVSDYHLSASVYYYYLKQDKKAGLELDQINPAELAASDSTQWTYYGYMMASVNRLGGSTLQDEARLEFDSLLQILLYAREKGLVYMEANILETFVEKLLDAQWREAVMQSRGAIFSYLEPELPDSLTLCESLSIRAIDCFRKYGDYYQIAGAQRGLADVYFTEGKYTQALQLIEEALDNVNRHCRKYNPGIPEKYLLKAYNPTDTLDVDLYWMENDSISCVPQWIANIRQSLSMVYAALGNKPASDYNRNIYLDLLDKTRQDKEQESRFEQLDQETRNLNYLFWGILGITSLFVLIIFYQHHEWRKKNRLRIARLNQTAALCNRITSSIPSDLQDEGDLWHWMNTDLARQFEQVLGYPLSFVPENGQVVYRTAHGMSKEEKRLISLIMPFLNWSYQFGTTLLNLSDDYKTVEKEKYLHVQHIAEKKRENLDKRTCLSIVSGITPFLDRALNEVNRLNTHTYELSAKMERYAYIHELIDKINEYNDIIALWIKMKQGVLSLHVENFRLQDILDTIAKSRRAYEVKQQQFLVDASPAVIKADKTLTLFMVNTLCENARKYTPAGGTIHLFATETPEFVEISIQDTGIGLSDEDQKKILEEKVYDSSSIGLHDGTDEQQANLLKNKGFGFGLMNCKGIIDKYRKTNALFHVCRFGIESRIGQGSRFYFRLPKGVLRMLTGVLLLATSGSLHARNTSVDLQQASAFADSVYYCNIDGRYEQALAYADSACLYLNKHYLSSHPGSRLLMGMHSGDKLVELDWWARDFNTDYHIILDIRNEAAVAALALGQWDTYRTNNEGYTRLYKELSQDRSLDKFCAEMEKSATNWSVSILILIVLIILFFIVFYGFFFRQELFFRLNVQQVLALNKKLLEHLTLHADSLFNPKEILQVMHPDLISIQPVEGLAICIKNADGRLLPVTLTDESLRQPELEQALHKSIRTQTTVILSESFTTVYPLLVGCASDRECVGSFAFIQSSLVQNKNEDVLRNIILSYLAIVIYQTVIRLSGKQAEVELVEDEKRRAMHEDNLLHIQNMMLDNCLSTLKHETMYYPNRIRQIVDELQKVTEPEKEISLRKDMTELMLYYKELFTLLSAYANRQLESIKFSRTKVPVQDLLEYADKFLEKYNRKNQTAFVLQREKTDCCMLGDAQLLCYLMESLVRAVILKEKDSDTTFTLAVSRQEGFIRVDLTDKNGSYSQEELNQWFYPDIRHMQDACWLTLRQIVRDHDELCGFRGCRINAEALAIGGYKLWLTIPESK